MAEGTVATNAPVNPDQSGSPAGAQRGPDGKFLPRGADTREDTSGIPVSGGPAGGAQAGDVAAAAKEAARKYKVKVDGQELEVEEGELLRGYSHQRAANKILQEGRAARKQAEEFIAMMKDPDKLAEVLPKLGHDMRKLAENYLSRQLEDEMMDPRDRELRDTKAKLKQIEAMEAAQREAVQAKRHEEMKAKYSAEYTAQFVEALKKSNLPPTKPMVAEMAKYIARSAKIGFKMTPDEAAQLVQEDVQRYVQRVVGDADGETLLKLLGDQVPNKIRKYDTDRLKSPEQVLRTPTDQRTGDPRPARDKKSSRLTPAEWRLHKMGLR